MSVKVSVNERFKLAVNDLIKSGVAKNKLEIATKIGIGNSKLSEILNGRMTIGIEDLANFCSIFTVDANWILNEIGRPGANAKSDSKENANYLTILEELVETQKLSIELLQRRNAELEKVVKNAG